LSSAELAVVEQREVVAVTIAVCRSDDEHRGADHIGNALYGIDSEAVFPRGNCQWVSSSPRFRLVAVQNKKGLPLK